MATVLPSEAVKLILKVCPHTSVNSNPTLGHLDAKGLAAVIATVDEIPRELLAVDSATLTEFIEATAVVRYFIDECRTLGNNARGIPGSYVTVIRDVLQKCPDQAVPAATASLSFIQDQGFRDDLRADIASVDASFKERDWKAATVMAGSVMEALLLWALQQKPAAAVQAQLNICTSAGACGTPRRAAPEEWDLHHYIEVAAGLGFIKSDTASQLRIAKDFRNLIHPGRVVRLSKKCDRGTALAAAAGVEFAIRDLTP